MSAKKSPEAWHPAEWELADASAIQALARGDANADQQRRALEWIVNQAAGTYQMQYRPGSARDTDFSLGRQFVGQQIVKMTKLNISQFKKK